MSESNVTTSSDIPGTPAEPAGPARSTLIPRMLVSAVVAVIVAGLLSVGGYFLMGAVENRVLEIVLMTAMYIVGFIVSLLLRTLAGSMKLIDLLMFLIFGLTFVIIGFQYASNALA